MKKLALILGSVMILGAVAVNAQDMSMKQMKDTTHMKSKKPVPKKSDGNYQMKKKSVKPSQDMNQPMEDTTKVKSKGKPVYKK